MLKNTGEELAGKNGAETNLPVCCNDFLPTIL